MTGKQEGPYKGEETKAEEDKVWQYPSLDLVSHWISRFSWNYVSLQKLRGLKSVSHGLNSRWAVLWQKLLFIRISEGLRSSYQLHLSSTFFYFVSNQTTCAEMCLPSTNPVSLSLSPAESPVPPTQLRSICLQDTNPYFFHPRYHTHTHTHSRWFSSTGRHMLTPEPHTSASLALSS